MSPDLSRLPKAPLSPRELGEFAQLLFEWPIRQAPRLTLPLCIVLAAVVQTVAIVGFSIGYEALSARLAPAPRFYFLPPDSAAARQLAPWLEANDPALFAPGRATATALPPPPPLKYRPSYEEPPPPLLPLPEQERQPIVPPPVSLTSPTESLQRRTAPSPVENRPQGVVPATHARWLDGLAGILPLLSEGRPEALPRRTAPGPSLYQAAVGPEGIPMHCTLIESSGNAETDEAGLIWIMARRFQPAASPSWGRVILPWEPSPAATP